MRCFAILLENSSLLKPHMISDQNPVICWDYILPSYMGLIEALFLGGDTFTGGVGTRMAQEVRING